MRKINRIIIHCSASSFGDASLIDSWHKERGWKSIGYHYVILNGRRDSKSAYRAKLDGLVEPGRDESVIGAHCQGQNKDSIGVCLIGIKDFTPAQLASLYTLVTSLMKKYNLTSQDVFGHYEFTSGKTCPNIDMNIVRAGLEHTKK
jgi:hypothetical protein